MARLRPSRIALAVGLLTGCSAALAEPVSIIFTVSGFWAAAGYVAATYGTAIALAYGVVQSQLASSAARRQQAAAAAASRSQYNASLQDRNVTGLSGESPWQVIYGNPAPVGGSIAGIFTSGARDQYKHLVIAFAAHECQSIDEVYIDGDPVGGVDGIGDVIAGAFFDSSPSIRTEVITFDVNGIGSATYPPTKIIAVEGVATLLGGGGITLPGGNIINAGTTYSVPTAFTVTYATPQGTGRVNLQKHLSPGSVDTLDQYLTYRAPQWTATDLLSGFTYIVLSLDLELSRFQGGPPAITARIRGKKVYDYRTGATVYSSNPALCLADFITSEPGFNAARSQISSASVIAAANACDASGFSCDGSFKTDQAREATKQQLEDSFGGFSHQSGGVWRITPGAWTTPVLNITDADSAAPIQIDQAGYLSKERYNTVRGKYVDAAGLGVATDFTPWQNPFEVAADGLVKVRDITLPFTYTHQRTQDLARMLVERSRGGLTITYPGQMRLWPLQPGDRVTVTNAEFGFVAKTFRVIDWSFHPKTPVALQMVEDVPAYYNAAALITADAAPNTSLPNPYAQIALTGLSAESGTNQLLRQADGTITTRVLLRWNAATAGYVSQGGSVQIQTKLATDTGDVWTPADILPGDSVSTFLLGLNDRTSYIIRARFINQLGIEGPWSVIGHTVIGKTEPPPDVVNFSIDGTRLSWTPVDALDLAGYEIRFNYGANTWWEAAASMHHGIITSTPYVMAQRLQGTVTLLIKAVDTSGNYSANAASIVANLGSPLVSNLFLSVPQAPLFADGVIVNGAVAAGALQATALDRFFEPADEPMFSPDTADFYPAGQYAQMSYTWSVTPTVAGKLLLDYAITSSNFSIEYQRGSQDAMFAPAGDYMFAPGADSFFGAPGAFAVWPGSIDLSASEQITFRITTGGGAVQGQVTKATPMLDVPDVLESFNDLVISAAGTRLPITRSYRVIENIQITVQADGNGGVTARVEDKNASLGPLIRVFNAAGAAVSGLVDIDLQGY